MKRSLTVLVMMLFFVNSVFAGTFKADAKTKRISAGTIFKLEFMQPVSTFSGGEGDAFSAMPMGSVVRGSISTVNSAKRFSRGAKLYLDFDHVVTPSGRQIPLDLTVSQFADTKIFYARRQ